MINNQSYQVNGGDENTYNNTTPYPMQNVNLYDNNVQKIENLRQPKELTPEQLAAMQSHMISNVTNRKPHVEIIVQPASKACRFRYECEGRVAGAIMGEYSTNDRKNYPTIKVVGYKGRAIVVASCVTKDAPYRPHPHNLAGKKYCKKGVCTMEVNKNTMTAVFNSLSIQCVKIKDIESSLLQREEIRVDPFKTGFKHRLNPKDIDLYSVRLCFQVFIESEPGRFTRPLPPVVSEPLYDRKAISTLVICRLCSCSAPVSGNTSIMLSCEKVGKDDILVRFFEENEGRIVWEAFGSFRPSNVYKQSVIWFLTPPYRDLDITEPVQVYIQLQRKSNMETSEALPFEFTPDWDNLRAKRQRTDANPNLYLQKELGRKKNLKDQNCLNLTLLLPKPPSIPIPKHLLMSVPCPSENNDGKTEIDYDHTNQQETAYSPQQNVTENNHQFVIQNMENFSTNTTFNNPNFPTPDGKLIAAAIPQTQTQWNNLAQHIENQFQNDSTTYYHYPETTKILTNPFESETAKDNGPTVSSLLNISSTQLVQIDSEDQTLSLNLFKDINKV